MQNPLIKWSTCQLFSEAAVSQTRFTYFDSLILQHFIEYYEKYFFSQRTFAHKTRVQLSIKACIKF